MTSELRGCGGRPPRQLDAVARLYAGRCKPLCQSQSETVSYRQPTLQRWWRALAAVAALGTASCQTTADPRALTRGNYMPLCIVFCEITTSLTSHEGVNSTGSGATSSTQTGGTATATQGVTGKAE